MFHNMFNTYVVNVIVNVGLLAAILCGASKKDWTIIAVLFTLLYMINR